MRIAYADPPYPSRNPYRYYESQTANHRLLIAYLEEFDGWALSTSSYALVTVAEWLPEWTAIAAWVRTPGRPAGNRPMPSWEPVIYKPARPNRHILDSTSRQAPARRNFVGAKPYEFCAWLFELLGADRDDEFHDVFPGSGAVSDGWRRWSAQMAML